MAEFKVSGLDRLTADLDAMGKMSEEDIRAILRPPAKLLTEAFRTALDSLFSKVTGALRSSIRVKWQHDEYGVVIANIGPNDRDHPIPPRKGTRKRKAQKGPSYPIPNSTLAYMLEFGTQRIPAKHWMENTIRENEEEVYRLLAEGFDNYINSIGF